MTSTRPAPAEWRAARGASAVTVPEPGGDVVAFGVGTGPLEFGRRTGGRGSRPDETIQPRFRGGRGSLMRGVPVGHPTPSVALVRS